MVLGIRRLSPQQDALCLADSHGPGEVIALRGCSVKSTFVHFHSSYGRTRHFQCAYLSKIIEMGSDCSSPRAGASCLAWTAALSPLRLGLSPGLCPPARPGGVTGTGTGMVSCSGWQGEGNAMGDLAFLSSLSFGGWVAAGKHQLRLSH